VDALIQSLAHACTDEDAAGDDRSTPAAATLKDAVVRRIETDLDALADRIADRILLRLNGSPTDPEKIPSDRECTPGDRNTRLQPGGGFLIAARGAPAEQCP
jgi:hypothetical protein